MLLDSHLFFFSPGISRKRTITFGSCHASLIIFPFCNGSKLFSNYKHISAAPALPKNLQLKYLVVTCR